METTPTVKILLAYHKPSTLLKPDDVFVPIHVGRELAEKAVANGIAREEDEAWMRENAVGDNTGDNISSKNKQYCELTAMYWAWKHYEELGDPNYIGFMHYRRHLCFDLKNGIVPDSYGLIRCPKITEDYIKRFHLRGETIRRFVKDYDVVVAGKIHANYMKVDTVYEQYKNSLHHYIKDYDVCMTVVKELYPAYSSAVSEYNKQPFAYFTNIFLMKKELFMEYADWLFTILEETERRLDFSWRNVQEMRALAYISERLLGIWLMNARHVLSLRIAELKKTFIDDTSFDISPVIHPAFNVNNIAICFAFEQKYAPYASVAIHSIIANSSATYNYDINILHNSIPIQLQDRIKRMQKPNVKIRFWDVDSVITKRKDMLRVQISHNKKETYYRFVIPNLFHEYDKVLYLDCDLVAIKDVATLYNTKLSKDEWLACVHDTYVQCAVKKGFPYFCSKLGMQSPVNYFQAGVLLFNIHPCIQNNLSNKLFSTLEKLKTPMFDDQDVINVVCEDHVHFLDLKWNVEWHLLRCWVRDYASVLSCANVEEYENAYRNPWIIHYCGQEKPWEYPDRTHSSIFWEYAKQTPFYEDILFRNLRVAQPSGDVNSVEKLLRELRELPKLKHKLSRVRFRLLFSFGKRQKKLKQRKAQLKKSIRDIESTI